MLRQASLVHFADGFDEPEAIAFGLPAPQLATVAAGALLAWTVLRLPPPAAVDDGLAALVAGLAAVAGWGRWAGRPVLAWAWLGARFVIRRRRTRGGDGGILLAAGGDGSDLAPGPSLPPLPEAGEPAPAGPPDQDDREPPWTRWLRTRDRASPHADTGGGAGRGADGAGSPQQPAVDTWLAGLSGPPRADIDGDPSPDRSIPPARDAAPRWLPPPRPSPLPPRAPAASEPRRPAPDGAAVGADPRPVEAASSVPTAHAHLGATKRRLRRRSPAAPSTPDACGGAGGSRDDVPPSPPPPHAEPPADPPREGEPARPPLVLLPTGVDADSGDDPPGGVGRVLHLRRTAFDDELMLELAEEGALAVPPAAGAAATRLARGRPAAPPLPARPAAAAHTPVFVGAPRRIAFFSLNGGSGRTTLATEVACLLAARGRHRGHPDDEARPLQVALVDLDLRSANVAVRLGIPQPTLWDYLLHTGDHPADLEGHLVTHSSGLRALLGPPKPLSATTPALEPAHVAEIVYQLERTGRHFLVFDVSADLGAVTTWVLSAVHDIFVVITPTASGVQDAYRSTEALRRLGLGPKLRYVVNRARGALDLDDVMSDLGGRVIATVPWDARVEEAENRHRSVALDGHGPAAGALQHLASAIYPGLLPARRRGRLGALLRRRVG